MVGQARRPVPCLPAISNVRAGRYEEVAHHHLLQFFHRRQFNLWRNGVEISELIPSGLDKLDAADNIQTFG